MVQFQNDLNFLLPLKKIDEKKTGFEASRLCIKMGFFRQKSWRTSLMHISSQIHMKSNLCQGPNKSTVSWNYVLNL